MLHDPDMFQTLGTAQTAAAFAAAMRVTTLEAVFLNDHRLDCGPSLGARLRGVWGARLMALAARNDKATDEAKAARAIFFPDKIDRFATTASPPYRFSATQGAGRLTLRLSLIGMAERWRTIAFDALIAALTEPPGLQLAFGTLQAAELNLIEARWMRREGLELPRLPNRAALDFQTPLRIGAGTGLGYRFSDVIVGLAERAAQTAPWLGIAFTPNLSQWRDIANGLRIDGEALKPAAWNTWSSANGRDRAEGWLGRLIVHAPDAETHALLKIGEVLYAGRGATKGYGRYLLAPDV